ncbi:ABC transporter permease [Paracoccus aminophilus]|uniref:ABC-type dipeptide/oligopeptide/nickel transport systems, permease component n=1 Tax=Paracoccus aminophilus JCM 7686 TaxID=1367847 RepID=S5YH20_PARAH|nr:ABC transporter permease [Paracoccus aminophilus]AGT10768.1 ABC-type dipeptide/oligopeptide/nickel transport systems, permease component [Paracoccus aminophilus JCM 7686]
MSASYILKRIALVFYTLFVVSVLVFGITQILPADAAVMMLGENATTEALDALRNQMGLNDPIWQQYLHWAGGVLQGDFGQSLRTGQPVGPALFSALGTSLTLAVFSLCFMLVIAVPIGVIAAVRRGKAADLVVGLISYIGVSLPEFVTATLAVALIADWWGILPPAGYIPLSEDFWGGLQRLVLPVLVVSVMMIAHVSRMVRSELVDVLHSDYIRAARLKGLRPRRVLLRHGLRNALLPTITIVALDVGYLLGGVIVVEEIFSIPGIGRALMTAIQARDLPVIQAGVMIMAATYSIVNFAADLMYAWLDKRIQYD